MTAKILTQKRLKELLHYDSGTGIFTWLVDRGNSKSGRVAGSIYNTGYSVIAINKKRYLAHRLAWLYVKGEHPENETDHINHDRADNRIDNLRCVVGNENSKNQTKRRDNNSGVTGVCWHKKSRRWRVTIRHNNKTAYIGSYGNLFDAACARKPANIRCGYHQNHGRDGRLYDQP